MNRRILHSGSKARDKGDSRSPWLVGSLEVYVTYNQCVDVDSAIFRMDRGYIGTILWARVKSFYRIHVP